jgi:hypothetical protein
MTEPKTYTLDVPGGEPDAFAATLRTVLAG